MTYEKMFTAKEYTIGKQTADKGLRHPQMYFNS